MNGENGSRKTLINGLIASGGMDWGNFEMGILLVVGGY